MHVQQCSTQAVKMPTRHWEPCRIFKQSQLWLTLRSPRQRLRRRMSMRAGERLCFSVGKYPVYSPQFGWHCVSRAPRLECMSLFWKSSHTCYTQSAPDRSQRSGVIPARCSKRLFSRPGLVYFPAIYSSSLHALCCDVHSSSPCFVHCFCFRFGCA